MQATTGHYVRLDSEDLGGAFFDVHQFKQADRAPLVIEEQIDVRVFPSLLSAVEPKR